MKHHREKKMPPLSPGQFYILTALAGKEQNKAEIRRRAVENSHGEYGTFRNLASNLPRLVRKGWIEVDTFQRRPEDLPGKTFYYHLLPAGRTALAEEVKRLETAVEKANQKLSLAKQQLSLPVPPPFEPPILKVQSTLPLGRATKDGPRLSALRNSRKRKVVEALRQKHTISVQELAPCLGVSRGAIYWWCRQGILESTRVEGKYGLKTHIMTASVLRVIEGEGNE